MECSIIAQENEDGIDKILEELCEAAPTPALSEDNKSKKKKGGKEEDDIDIILVEIGEGQAKFAPTPQEKKGQLCDDAAEKEEVVEEGFMESVATKKKKKTKEKENKKKAVAAASIMEEETKNDTKGKLVDKKQSKQVREMRDEVLIGRKKGTECEEENYEIAKQGGGGRGKSKKKNRVVIDDDEYSFGTELSEELTIQDETVV
ncbi:hypothetical protein RND71_036778 [Anisodus tanguticus]|uniref:Uncharacterized protein n=1 Tax=Anisodus tanguticus TaxID=243964 RepID=A0AAE1R2U3_9SOLA|nr:hypothetical protein RND71_036778 [Anisodus tanguticus]